MTRYFLLLSVVVLISLHACKTAPRKADLEPFGRVAGSDNATSQIVPGNRFKELEETAHQKPSGDMAESIQMPSYEQTAKDKPAFELHPVDPKKLTMQDKPVMINVDGMALSDFIIYAVGDALKVTFFIDEAVKGMKTPVTLRMTKEMSAAGALDIVVELLRQKGLLVGEKAGSLYILKPATGTDPTDVMVGRTPAVSSMTVVQVINLRYVGVADLAPLITELYKGTVTTKTYPRDNALIVMGVASAMKSVISFIDTMDVPYLHQRKLSLLRLTYWKPEEFVTQLTSILKGLGIQVSADHREPGVMLIQVKSLNGVLVSTPDQQVMDFVQQWRDKLDSAESAGTEEKTFSYVPRYSKASELVESVQKLYGVVHKADVRAKAEVRSPVSTTPAVTTTATATPAPVSPQGTVTELFVQGLKIASDDRRNIVIMMTTPSIYRNILGLLREIDTPPRQVLIEATIAEMTLDDQNSMGFEWYLSGRMLDGKFALSTLGQLGLDKSSGMVYHFTADNSKVESLINMLATDKKIEILSKPHLMVLDNTEATIQIGNDVPIISSEVSSTDVSSSTTTPSVLRNVQYKSTGVLMRLKPTINAEGFVTMEISQEVSEAQTNQTSNIDSPLILKRRINTSVVAANGQTVIIGGIRSKNVDSTEKKVPLLGDIPILGYAFKSSSDRVRRTELIVLITPRILSNPDDTSTVTQEIKGSFLRFKRER
ncbi:MAG: hypothetical protein HQL05_04280 [Nitrospirae bacterium]|uniref:secretin N-terminal domain-containing protein n=1 Tax=Candidatus Magnetobacterium casense TaxID=1455061 RepID=UPI0009DE0F66|nr:secretin N-terminal domain-containing protein [Candidatus Magnetobacterium casensis]MBF0337028.1 hypothetical protein [Nitrospirota bacterium]